MAITRTQIAKQLLANGGRIGLKGGADASGKEVSISPTGDVRTSNVSPGAGNSRRGPGPDDRSTKQQNINQLRSQNRFIAEDEDLQRYVDLAVFFTGSLPPKVKTKKPHKD